MCDVLDCEVPDNRPTYRRGLRPSEEESVYYACSALQFEEETQERRTLFRPTRLAELLGLFPRYIGAYLQRLIDALHPLAGKSIQLVLLNWQRFGASNRDSVKPGHPSFSLSLSLYNRPRSKWPRTRRMANYKALFFSRICVGRERGDDQVCS